MTPIRSSFICLRGTKLSPEEAHLLKKYNPVGLTLFKRNIETPDQVKQLTDDIRTAVGRDDFLIAIDQEGGLVRRLRPPYWRDYVSQQQLGNLPPKVAPKAIKAQARLIADDLHHLGINVVFSPVADTFHPKTTGAIAERCFSSDPRQVAKDAGLMAKTYMEKGICPCMKHLPGHGGATADSHLELPCLMMERKLIERDFLPFQKMARFIPLGMTAHVVLPQLDYRPITQSPKGISLIRNAIGFDGLLITDAIEMKALRGSLTQRVELSLSAGCDVVCYCSGHCLENPYLIEENTEVLQASKPLSDKSLERLSKVIQVVQKPYISRGIKKTATEYEQLVQRNYLVSSVRSDCITENWATRINQCTFIKT